VNRCCVICQDKFNLVDVITLSNLRYCSRQLQCIVINAMVLSSDDPSVSRAIIATSELCHALMGELHSYTEHRKARLLE